jgi:DNA-binding transcriptional ArsR family regulator
VRLHLADGARGVLRRRPAHDHLSDTGLAELWREAPANHSDPLAALVGRTRARLATLGLPRTTSQLAVQIGLSPAAVSQHLKVLKETGLVTARRRGRMVLYQRTGAATTLLEAASSNQQAG